MSQETLQLPKELPQVTKRLSDDELRIRMQDIFFRSLAFRAAVGLALLGAVLIGLFTVNSSWTAFNARNTVAAAQEELEKSEMKLQEKRDEFARTESNLATLERQSEETTGKYNLVKTQFNDIVNEA
jgi:septal ring factor EnvC (AmiA/AmiB activator)